MSIDYAINLGINERAVSQKFRIRGNVYALSASFSLPRTVKATANNVVAKSQCLHRNALIKSPKSAYGSVCREGFVA